MKPHSLILFLAIFFSSRNVISQQAFRLSSLGTYSVSGQVSQGAGLLNDGIITAINVATLESRTKKVVNGLYTIDSLELGTYILYVVPNPTTVPNYLPTYWVNKTNPNNANRIYIDGIYTDVNVTLVAAPTKPSGSSHIIGRFSYMDGHSDKGSSYDKNWFGKSYAPTTPITTPYPPCETMPVQLYNSSNQLVFWTVTDTLGYFDLPNLPADTYQLLGQRNGYSTYNNGMVTLASGATQRVSLYMTPQYVVTDVENPMTQNSANLDPVTYPNPFKDELSFDERAPSNLMITDAAGRLYYQHDSFSEETIPTSSWPDGIYFLRAGNNVQKLIKR
jgi:hypothetical protein